MRFLLINPFCPITEGPTPPLGLSFLAAALENAGVEVKILDFTVFPYSKKLFEEHLNEFQPDIIGSTAVTMTYHSAVTVLKTAKSINPEILSVMGGPHVSFCAKETLLNVPELDLAVIGEGEKTIVEVVQEYESNKNWESINGLAFRSGEDVVLTQPRELVDLNTLGLPARHLLPLGRYRTLHTPISMTTSRGCPHRCIFCIGRKMVGSRVRYRDPMTVVDELELLAEYQFPQINIADDLFTAKKKHCFQICDEIIKRKLDIVWSSFARVDTVNLEVLERMKAAGCKTVSFGVETANSEILKTIKKGITLEKVRKAISMCTQAGLEPHVSFILGLPGETPESLKETQEFGKELDDMGALYGFHLLAPFPGTAIYDNNDDYDLKILTTDWSEYHANRAIVETANVNKDQLNDIVTGWESEAHENLGEIKRKMEAGTATSDESWQIENLDRFMFIYQMMMDTVIEENGTLINGSQSSHIEASLSNLSKNIYQKMGKSQEETYKMLEYILARKGIYLDTTGEEQTWKWKNYL